MRIQRVIVAITVVAVFLPVPVRADHSVPTFTLGAPLSSAANSGGEGAEWEIVTTFPTGNPHSDLDFFTQGGETYVSVGTLAIGLNAGGQNIFKLTEGGEVDASYVSGHPSASCISNPLAALGLQHDVEATPKGTAILNATNPFADRSDAQLLIDATDQRGRCHDQGVLGLANAPRGGLEIIDITDIENPVEIGLTSHIGEAHTVNVDPKRPHIVYAITSDSVNPGANEEPGSPQRFNLDGWEMLDISSCMNFPAGTSVEEKRDKCRPEVFRHRYRTQVALGHTNKGQIYGCHELEVYPDDRLACGGGAAAILFDMSRVFDDNGTPRDFTDDKIKGDPLPCRVRESSSVGPFATGAMVTDCVVGKDDVDLTIPGWIDIGEPSVDGVRHVGTAHHQGRGAGAFDTTEDIDFNHETELTDSGRFLIAADERGGGVVPPGATCSPGADLTQGNGGLHAYAVSRLDRVPTTPKSPEEAFDAYARTPEGDKAIYRAEVRTQPEATFCTAHVFQQIPGQNRIFMGWYTQGTQVVDFIEHKDGTFEFKEAGWFIPENANTWVSHVFKVEKNDDGTFTYWGATGDFFFGTAGRSAVDIYRVTLPAPPKPLDCRNLREERYRGERDGRFGRPPEGCRGPRNSGPRTAPLPLASGR
jgi:hypothetical protein